MKVSHHVRLHKLSTCYHCLLRKFSAQLEAEHCAQDQIQDFAQRFQELFDRLPEHTAAPALYYEGRQLILEYIPDTEEETYGPIKKMFNDALLSIEDELQAHIDTSDEPLELAIKIARAGNYLDVVCVDNISTDKLMEIIDQCTADRLDPAMLNRFQQDLERSSSLLYCTDNAGEAVLDKLLIRTIQKLYPHLNLTIMVRGGLAQSDITVEDAKAIGLTDLAPVIHTGLGMPGIQISYLPEAQLQVFENTDIIIAKGQGNFEGLGGCGLNVYFLFLCKCHVFTEQFQLPQFSGCFLNELDL